MAQEARLYPDTLYFPIFEAAGIRQIMGRILAVRGARIGAITFSSKQANQYSEATFALFNVIADQVAVAVANILDNEEILEREREKSVLLAISTAIATINDKRQLLKLIFEQVRPLFSFDDVGLSILEADGQHFNDWAAQFTDILPLDVVAKQSVQYRFAYPGSLIEQAIDDVTAAGHPLVYDLTAALAAQWPDAQTVLLAEIADQQKQTLATTLQAGGKVLGLINLNTKQSGHYSTINQPVFQAVADQVAVAVANILANEEILEREREKSVLLSISEDIASVRNKEDLLQVIIHKIKPLFDFYDCGILIIDKENRFYDLAAIHPQIDKSDVNYYLKDNGFYQAGSLPYANSGVEWIIGQVEKTQCPVVFDYTADYSSFSDGYLLETLKTLGYVEALCGVLKTGGRVFGCFTINYTSRGQAQQIQIPLFQNVVDQLSVAVANILANEEILEREREKALQLAVTTTLTSQMDWVDKFRQVVNEIGNVVPWDMVGVLLLQRPALSVRWRKNDDGSLHYLSYEQHSRELGVDPLELWDLFMETRPQNARSAVYVGEDFEQLRRQFRLIALTHQHWHIRSKVELFIPVNSLPQVMLVLSSQQPYTYTDAHLALLKRLMPSMSLALENIFSFEELAQREAEKTRQLALNKVLVSIRDSGRLFGAIADELNELVSFDSMSVRVIAEGRLQCYVVMVKTGGHFIDGTEQVRGEFSKLEEMELQEASVHPGQAIIYTGEAFERRCAGQPMYRLRQEHYGLRSTIELPLPMKEGQPALLILSSRAAYAFTDGDLAKLSLFIPQVALAMENLLSFEEITSLKKRLEQEKSYLVEEIKITHNFEEIIGTSPLLTQVFRQVGQVAPTDTSVLITGESGTGKELIARAIHNRSPRKDRVLVKINCAALPASLIESELFGHEKGAFTGAIDKRVGKFELANGGTIFLDEIGEMPLELQSKLLRVLQEREYERLGSNKLLKTDVRVITATNRDLSKEVAEGRFRLDLFYRLSVFPVHMPPLRERPEDIPLLAHYFARKYCKKMGKSFRGIQEQTMLELMTYPWPGNIRELENVMEQTAILNDGTSALAWGRSENRSPALPVKSAPVLSSDDHPSITPEPVPQTVGAIRQASVALERERILTVLKQTGGRIRGEGGAAQLLGLKATTLEARIARLGIKRDYTIR